MFMIILKPGRRLTWINGKKEYEALFRTQKRAEEFLEELRNRDGEKYPQAKIVTQNEYWAWPKK